MTTSTSIKCLDRLFALNWFQFNCMLKVCDTVCQDKRQLLSNVSLTRNTVAERMQQLSKGKGTTELRDKKFLWEVAFLCDIFCH